MGLGSSTPEISQDTKANVQKLFDVDIDNEKEFLESLNISDLHIRENKPTLPIIGGQNVQDESNQDNDIDFNLLGGGDDKDVRFMARRRRYLRHNIFKTLAELDRQKGGNGIGEEEKYLSTSSDDEAIKNIKEIILKEVNKLNTSTAQSGGGCGCDGNKDDSESKQEGGAKRRKSKSKSKKQKGGESDDENSESELEGGAKRRKSKSKKQKGGERRQKKQTEEGSSSSDSSSSESSSDDDSEESYNAKRKTTKKVQQSESSLRTKSEESSETENSSNNSEESEESEESSESQRGGLSIFPFNSSEVKSSVSEKKNMRMIRRKI